MTKTQLGEFRELLEQERDRLKSREYRARDMRDLPDRSGYGYDLADRASVEEDTNRIATQSEAHLLGMLAINAALLRMQEGTYGDCVDCGDELSPGRLRAIPQASRCTSCARLEEQGLRETWRPLL